MSSFEKSVKGATKIKLAAPKSKYVEHILVATHAGEQGVAEVFRVLQNRLRDSTWTIVFKSLIIVHFMIREGEPNVTLRHLSSNPQRKLAINNFTEVQTQGRNIKNYAEYLVQRVKSYTDTKVDFVRAGEGRLTKLSVDKGLLREVESVQDTVKALLRCDFLTLEPENDISLTAFRLLIMDLLVLFHVMNEGLVNILQHFFEMSKPDAERTLHIYRTFVKQTDHIVKYLSVARNYEHVTRLEIPTLKHAPVILADQLQDYVKDPDFEVMRRQYLAQQGAKKGIKPTNGSSKPLDTKSSSATGKAEPFPEPKTAATSSQPKGPAPDLIDFFESIEQNQTSMNTNPFQQQQQPQFAQQSGGNQPFAQQPMFGAQQTGMPLQQNNFPIQPTGIAGQTGPFGQQLAQPPAQQAQFSQPSFGASVQTSPYNQGISDQNTPFGMANPAPPQQQQQQVQTTFSPVQSQPTGNPFAQSQIAPPAQQLQPTFTGAGFGGYTPQPQQNRFTPGLSSIPQNNVSSFQSSNQLSPISAADSSASSNPFRQSMLPTSTGTTINSFTSNSTAPSMLSPQSTNPFAKSASPAQHTPTPPNANTPFAAPTSQFSNMSLGASQPPAQSLIPAPTGTNPFARPMATSSPAGGGLIPPPPGSVTTHVTGSTNPFRQSQFVNQNTGMGWQQGPQGTIAGMSPDHIDTTSVFPRPGGGNPQAPHQQQPGAW